VRKGWLFQYRRLRSSKLWLILRCRACCMRTTLLMHSTRLLARQVVRKIACTPCTACCPTAPAFAKMTAHTNSSPRQATAWRLRPGDCRRAAIPGVAGAAAEPGVDGAIGRSSVTGRGLVTPTRMAENGLFRCASRPTQLRHGNIVSKHEANIYD